MNQAGRIEVGEFYQVYTYVVLRLRRGTVVGSALIHTLFACKCMHASFPLCADMVVVYTGSPVSGEMHRHVVSFHSNETWGGNEGCDSVEEKCSAVY